MPPPKVEEVKTALDKSRWIAAKRALIARGLFPWLKAFEKDMSVDAIIFDKTKDCATKQPQYDPYQIESLAASASKLLDRCLVYRRDMYDLEEKAIRRALEYQLFIDESPHQLAIEKAEHTHEQKEVEAKWKALNDFRTALQDQHSTPGNPLNYGDRFNRIRKLLEPDIATAYDKIRCVQLAANKIFGLATDPLDPPSEIGYLDYLVVTLRDIIRQIEIATKDEVDFEHVISLKQPRRLKAGQTQLITNATWNSTLHGAQQSGLLSFSLKNDFPAAVQRLRVRAIGLSLQCDQPENPISRERTTAAVVFAPAVENLFSPGSGIPRPPVIIEKIDQFVPNNTKFFVLPAVANIDPREDQFGGWQIQVSTNMLWPDVGVHGRDDANILDLKLHLKLSAITDKSPSQWTDFAV
jgi:hypothetical protein